MTAHAYPSASHELEDVDCDELAAPAVEQQNEPTRPVPARTKPTRVRTAILLLVACLLAWTSPISAILVLLFLTRWTSLPFDLARAAILASWPAAITVATALGVGAAIFAVRCGRIVSRRCAAIGVALVVVNALFSAVCQASLLDYCLCVHRAISGTAVACSGAVVGRAVQLIPVIGILTLITTIVLARRADRAERERDELRRLQREEHAAEALV